MDHPEYLSPLQKFLRYLYLPVISTAGVSAEQAKWVVTGTAAILGVIVANLGSVREVVSSGALKCGICFLTISMLIGIVVVVMANSIKHAVLVVEALYKKLSQPEGKASIEGITADPEEVIDAMVEPFYGPLKIYMKSSAYRGSMDFLATEKRSISMVCTVVYLSIVQGVLGAIGLIAIAMGIK
jgi:hypothetical protein